MPFLGVIQHHNLLGSEKENLSRNLEIAITFVTFPKPSTLVATAEEIATAGEQVLVSMYNGKPGGTLDYVRYKCFCAKVTRNTSHIQPKTLPPTSAAAKFHSLCVYHQVKQWNGAGDGPLPEEWGWKESE